MTTVEKAATLSPPAPSPQGNRDTRHETAHEPSQETPGLRTPKSGSGLLVWTHCEGTPDSPPPRGRLRPGQSHANARPVPVSSAPANPPPVAGTCAQGLPVKAPGHH